MYCKKCGTVISSEKLVCCPICGERLTEKMLSEEKPKVTQKKVASTTSTSISTPNTTNSLPRVAIAILILNIIGFILELAKGESYMTFKYGMYEGALSNGGLDRMIFSGFLHYGFMHLLSNMICLISFGFSLESFIGSKKFVIVYLASLIGGSLMINFIGGNGLHAGASGAIWGLMTASLYVNIRYHTDWTSTLKSIAINIIYSFSAGVSWQGHLGGGIAGLIIAFIVLGQLQNEQNWICPNCQKTNSASTDVCSECGNKRDV